MNFIIADDEKSILDNTCKHIKRYIAEKGIESSVILSTTRPQDVLSYSCKNYEKLNVYILDIDFENEMNGLSLARSIRDREPNAYIIFLTAYIQLSMMVFKYRLKVFDFLVKPVSHSDLIDCLDALFQDYTTFLNFHLPMEPNFINIKSGYQEYRIPANSIIYIESFGPKLIIHTTDGKVEYYGALKNIEKSLKEIADNFFRCHKSFLINTKYIKEVNLQSQEATMVNGDKCMVSRSKKNLLKEACSN